MHGTTFALPTILASSSLPSSIPSPSLAPFLPPSLPSFLLRPSILPSSRLLLLLFPLPLLSPASYHINATADERCSKRVCFPGVPTASQECHNMLGPSQADHLWAGSQATSTAGRFKTPAAFYRQDRFVRCSSNTVSTRWCGALFLVTRNGCHF
jgi:hypothetical protein